MRRALPSCIIASLFVIVLSSTLLAQPRSNPVTAVTPVEADQWRQDLRLLAEEMPKRHKNLFHSMTREQFDRAVQLLNERIPTLARYQIIVEIHRIVAMVEDGHTSIRSIPFDPKGGIRTYPFTSYLYKDGLFVQSADPAYAEAVGARIVRIGDLQSDDAIRAVRDLAYHDNEYSRRAYIPFLLITPEVLAATGVVSDMENARFVFERNGRQFTLDVKPIARPAFAGLGTNFLKPAGWIDARDKASAPLPLYLRDPENLYWFEYISNSKTIYVQYNAVQNKPDESIAEFANRLFAFVDSHPVERFILDMRNNGGGNNYLNRPLLLGIIKSKIDQRGKFFTIIGRRTFSAAQNLINELEKYTNAIFVGEPTGENVNFYGDPFHLVLPNSGFVVRISGLWWQNMDPRDRREWTGPQLAVELTSEDYRTNRDPAMELIMAYVPKKDLTDSIMEALNANDIELARKRFRDFRSDPVNAFATVEDPINNLGYRLMELKRFDQAIAVLALNVEAFPQSANTYDSLGEAYLKAGNNEMALKYYEKAVEMDASNSNAAQIVRRLRAK